MKKNILLIILSIIVIIYACFTIFNKRYSDDFYQMGKHYRGKHFEKSNFIVNEIRATKSWDEKLRIFGALPLDKSENDKYMRLFDKYFDADRDMQRKYLGSFIAGFEEKR